MFRVTSDREEMTKPAPLDHDFDCTTCPLGPTTAYAPVLRKSPGAVESARKGVAHFRPSQTVLRSGEISRSIYTVVSGWAFSAVILPDGRRQIVSFLIPGDTICLMALHQPYRPASGVVKALTPLTACVFDVGDMRDMLFGPRGQRTAFDSIAADRINDLTRRLTDIGLRRASGRIAQFLLALEERLRRCGLSRDGEFAFPARQGHIADALGLTQVHVNRTLVQLRRQKLIDFSKGRMRITDFDGLRRMAEEE